MNSQNEHTSWHKMCYDAADMNEKVIMNLRDLGHTIRFLSEGKGSQKRILIILNEVGGSITQKELTERLRIQPGSASEVISKLESAGYIKRTPSETDRRTTNVTLTETGKTASVEAREERYLRHEQLLSCLSFDEKNQLLSLLEKVITDWEKRYQNTDENHEQCKHHHKDIHPQRRD